MYTRLRSASTLPTEIRSSRAISGAEAPLAILHSTSAWRGGQAETFKGHRVTLRVMFGEQEKSRAAATRHETNREGPAIAGRHQRLG